MNEAEPSSDNIMEQPVSSNVDDGQKDKPGASRRALELTNVYFCTWRPGLHKSLILLDMLLFLSLLFADEYSRNEHTRKIIESILFWAILMAPPILAFLPIQISFYLSFPRNARSSFLHWKSFLVECGLLLLLLSAIPLVLALHQLDSKEIIKKVTTVSAILILLMAMSTLDDKKELCTVLRHAEQSQPLFRVQKVLQFLRTHAKDREQLEKLEDKVLAMTGQNCQHCQCTHTHFVCERTFEGIAAACTLHQKTDGSDGTMHKMLQKEHFQTTSDLRSLVEEHLNVSSMLGNSSNSAALTLVQMTANFPSNLTIFLVGCLFYQATISVLPYTSALVIDAIATYDPSNDAQKDVLIPAAILMANFFSIPLFDFIALGNGVRLGEKVKRSIRNSLCRLVLGLGSTSSKGVRKLSPGDLSSRFSTDANLIGDFVSYTLFYDLSSGIIRTIITLILLGLFDARTAIFFAVCIPVLISVQGNPGKSTAAGISQASGNIQGTFQNLVKLRRTNELYHSGQFVFDTVGPRMDENYRALEEGSVRRSVFVTTVNGYTNAYLGIISFAFILSIVQRAEDGDDDLVLGVALGLQLISTIFSPIRALTRSGEVWLQCIPALHRMREVYGLQKSNNEISDKNSGSDTVPLLQESLVLQDIRFQYPAAREETLKGINLDLNAGEYVCIVGESGAGKSTVLNILTCEEQATMGQLLVDNHIVTNAASYQEQTSVVLQDGDFLEGTIRDNIRMGKPDATDEEIDCAVIKSQCSKFVKDLTDGIDTVLGPTLNVSGGQAQRISLARALVRSPRILILDEATSALDLSTEREVIDTISHLAQDDNVLVISVTHRLETTDSSNRIVVLENGTVAEEGPPSELNQNGTLFDKIRNGGESLHSL